MSDAVVSVGRRSDYPASAWGRRDRARAAQALGFQPMGEATTFVALPTHVLPAFELNPRRRPRAADRTAAADRLLTELGISPRKRRTRAAAGRSTEERPGQAVVRQLDLGVKLR